MEHTRKLWSQVFGNETGMTWLVRTTRSTDYVLRVLIVISDQDDTPSNCKAMQDGRVVVNRFSELGFRSELRFKATLAPDLMV